uniref:Uncharacterized protein n=1 Tax=Mycena chlorophos TaxID=658473 RepID=A0ABQ0LZI6_MYCCL|nr:predicted protein [Mycena chlorophos]
MRGRRQSARLRLSGVKAQKNAFTGPAPLQNTGGNAATTSRPKGTFSDDGESPDDEEAEMEKGRRTVKKQKLDKSRAKTGKQAKTRHSTTGKGHNVKSNKDCLLAAPLLQVEILFESFVVAKGGLSCLFCDNPLRLVRRRRESSFMGTPGRRARRVREAERNRRDPHDIVDLILSRDLVRLLALELQPNYDARHAGKLLERTTCSTQSISSSEFFCAMNSALNSARSIHWLVEGFCCAESVLEEMEHDLD